MRFCMSSGEVAVPALAALFLRLPGVAYVHDPVSPRLVQLSQGWPRLHFSLSRSVWRGCAVVAMAYFLCLHGPHDRGTRFLLRTTLNCWSGGEYPALDEVVEGGVGGILRFRLRSSDNDLEDPLYAMRRVPPG
jgi:hypothetical protein